MGLTIVEYAPFGVIGAITPVTHSLPTLAGNVITWWPAAIRLIVNPHPSGARIACEGVRRFNKAIHKATGLENLITIIEQPTLGDRCRNLCTSWCQAVVRYGWPRSGSCCSRKPQEGRCGGPRESARSCG